jgi:hypothetical protein
MLRKLLYVLIIATLNLSLLTGCGSDDDDSRSDDGRVGRSYVYGMLDGALASRNSCKPSPPAPGAARPMASLLMSPQTPCWGCPKPRRPPRAPSSTGGQHAVLVTRSRHHACRGAARAHRHRLPPLRWIGCPRTLWIHRAVRLCPTEREDADDGYRPALRRYAERTGAGRQQAGAGGVRAATWILEKVREPEPSASANRKPARRLAPRRNCRLPRLPWQIAVADTMAADVEHLRDPDQARTRTAVRTNHRATLPVGLDGLLRRAPPPNSRPITSWCGCSANHQYRRVPGLLRQPQPIPTRIAAYWLRQANMSAAPPGSYLRARWILARAYAPVEANPSTTVATGTTWSLSGTGTAGLDSDGRRQPAWPSAPGCRTAIPIRTATYQALQTQVNIGATGDNAASWTYDSWDFVHAGIEPAERMPVAGRDSRTGGALPSIIYGGDLQSPCRAGSGRRSRRFGSSLLANRPARDHGHLPAPGLDLLFWQAGACRGWNATGG